MKERRSREEGGRSKEDIDSRHFCYGCFVWEPMGSPQGEAVDHELLSVAEGAGLI